MKISNLFCCIKIPLFFYTLNFSFNNLKNFLRKMNSRNDINQDTNDNSINIELQTNTHKSKGDDNDDILITAETYDRLRDRTVNIKNKK